jgi:UDP-glucose 6-dehydrogenase
MKSIRIISVCGLGKLSAFMAATFAARGFPVVVDDIDVEKIRRVNAGLHLAQQLKCHGYRVLVHDYEAKPSNNPALHEFEILDNLDELAQRKNIQLAVVCCPWPHYARLKFSPATTVLPTWEL